MANEAVSSIDRMPTFNPDEVTMLQMEACWEEHEALFEPAVTTVDPIDGLLAISGVEIVPIEPKPIPRRLDNATHRWQPSARNRDISLNKISPETPSRFSPGDLAAWIIGFDRSRGVEPRSVDQFIVKQNTPTHDQAEITSITRNAPAPATRQRYRRRR